MKIIAASEQVRLTTDDVKNAIVAYVEKKLKRKVRLAHVHMEFVDMAICELYPESPKESTP